MRGFAKRGLACFVVSVLFVATLLSGAVTVFTTKTSEAAIVKTTVNDRTTGTGQNQFEYVGTWGVTNTGEPNNYNGDVSWSNTTNDYVQVRFTGTQIRIYGKLASHHGIGAVSIDGGTETNIDFYSSSTKYQTLMYSSPILANTTHTLKIRVPHTKNGSATDYYVVPDFVQIDAPDGSSTTTTVNDRSTGTGQNQFEYIGTWGVTSTGEPYNYNGDVSWSNTNNDYFQVRFTGTQIRFYGKMASHHGIGAVSIDGGTETNIDFYSSNVVAQSLLYTSPTLTNASHTLKIRVPHTKNASATDYYVVPDFVQVDAPSGSTQPQSYTASSEFNGTTQGPVWYYQTRPIGGSTYTNMTNTSTATSYPDYGAIWWGGTVGSSAWISYNKFHPDNTNDAVRTWVAPRNGTVNITGRAYKTNLSGGTGLNGVDVSIQKNNSVLWTKEITENALQAFGYLADSTVSGVTVTTGDSIHFIVSNNGDWAHDETAWDPTVTYTGATAPTNTTYYIASSTNGGSDSNSGTSSSSPWLTVAPLNNIHYFGSGVQILFHAGDTFAGGLNISMVGTSGSRDKIGIYGGTTNATLTDIGPSYHTSIAQLVNSEYVTVENLSFIGRQGTSYGSSSFVPGNREMGLEIYSTRTSGTKWQSIYVDNCLFQYTWIGLWVDSMTSSTTDGFNDLKLTDSIFDSVYQFGAYIPFGYNTNNGGPVNQSTNIYVADNQFKTIKGDPNYPSEAQGLFSGTATGITIERNLFANIAGYGGIYGGSPFGGSTAMSVANARNFKIQYNEAYGTKSYTKWDGSALDADQDAQNGEIAYNLTYQNAGPSVQLGSYGSTTTKDIAIHHNISVNDARGNTNQSVQGVYRIWGYSDAIQLFNNIVYLDQTGVLSGSIPSVINFEVGSNLNFKAWNNIFKTTQGIPMIRPNGTVFGEYNSNHIHSSNQFIANLYDSSSGNLIISTDNTQGSYTNVTSLTSWRSYGQEKILTTNYGVVADAGLSSLGTFNPTSSYLPSQQVSVVSNLDLTSGSATRGQANSPWSIVTLTTPMSAQTFDYHGNTGTITDIGADTY